jgi:hypothetical protein
MVCLVVAWAAFDGRERDAHGLVYSRTVSLHFKRGLGRGAPAKVAAAQPMIHETRQRCLPVVGERPLNVLSTVKMSLVSSSTMRFSVACAACARPWEPKL